MKNFRGAKFNRTNASCRPDIVQLQGSDEVKRFKNDVKPNAG